MVTESTHTTRREFLQGVGVASAIGAMASMLAHPTPVQAAGEFPMLNVKSYGALGDGSADETGAFQNALNAASSNGGGRVFAPRGSYRFNGVLSVPANVVLEGENLYPISTKDNAGTLLMPTSADSAFLTLASNAGIRGVTIYYPNQATNPPLIQYPPAIRSAGGDNNLVENVMLVNPWWGIDFETNPAHRHLIRGVYGQPLWCGISVDKCLDVGRIENVHFWPFWDAFWLGRDVGTTITYTPNNAYGIILKRTDWQIVSNYFAYGYHVGIGLYPGSTGEGMNGQMSNIGLDVCNVGIDIYRTQPYGVSISNLNATCNTTYGQTIRKAIFARAGNQVGPLSITNGNFWGSFSGSVIEINNGTLHLTNSFFRESGDPMINVTGGRAVIANNTFAEPIGRQAINVGAGADRVVITGNQLTLNSIVSAGPASLRMIQANLP